MDNDPASSAEQASRAEIERLTVDLREQRKLYRHDVAKLVDEIERLQEALKTIERWSEAYPFTVFPKPDYERAPSEGRSGNAYCWTALGSSSCVAESKFFGPR